MTLPQQLSSQQSSSHKLDGNEIFLLDQPEQAWRIQSGSVGIFAVSWQDDTSIGSRHYLFSLAAGEMLLGMRPARYGLVAIAFEPTTLKHIPSPTAEQLTNWSDRFKEIQSFPTSQSPEIFKEKSLFDRHTLGCIEKIITQRKEANLQQFQSRQQLNQRTAQTTLTGLASLLQPKDESYLRAKTPLLIVAGAVGHALGVEISPPGESEDLGQVKEPLEAIARASHLRLRPVLLRGQWWKQDSGPLVVYTQEDHLPMALIPIKDSRYELLNPATLQRVAGDRTDCQSARPQGICILSLFTRWQIKRNRTVEVCRLRSSARFMDGPSNGAGHESARDGDSPGYRRAD